MAPCSSDSCTAGSSDFPPGLSPGSPPGSVPGFPLASATSPVPAGPGAAEVREGVIPACRQRLCVLKDGRAHGTVAFPLVGKMGPGD